MNEEAYSKVTYDITHAAAETMARLNPKMTFIYVSGVGTDSTEKGRIMWARVKGRTENAVLRLFPNGYAFRPGVIQPLHGIKSRTPLYRVFYIIGAPLMPLLRLLMPGQILTTEEIGRAMLAVAKRGAKKHLLEPKDMLEVASPEGTAQE